MIKITPFIKRTNNYTVNQMQNISREVTECGKNLHSGIKDGINLGQRFSSAKKINQPPQKTLACIAGIRRKTKIRKKDIAPLMGAVGTFTPIPGGTILGYCAGKILTNNFFSKIFSFIVKK